MKLKNLLSNQQLDNFKRNELDQQAENYLLQLALGGSVQDVTIGEDKRHQIVQYHESMYVHASYDRRKQQAIDFFHEVKGAGTIIDFRTFDDNRDRKDPTLTRKLRGTIEECYDELHELNLRGAGIFFTVNTTDGHGVGNANIVSIDYMWIEDDGDDPDAVARCPLEPAIKVKTSDSHYHYYFKVEAGRIDVSEFKQYQSVMAEKYGSDPNALDPSRVLRAVGFFHCKVDSRKGLTGEMQLVEVCND